MTLEEYRKICMGKFEAKADEINERARINIEKHRKGNHTLCLYNADGSPAAGVKVRVTQKKHDFKHGANLFMLDEFDDPEINQRYRDTFAAYFNLATVPFFWNGTEPEEGKLRYDIGSPKLYRRPPADLCMEYCAEKGILPKLHCLFYDKLIPDWLPKNDRDAMWELYEKRFAEIAERYAGRMYEIEVTNELQSTPGWTTCSVLAHERDIGIRMWEMARRYFPHDQLMAQDSYPATVGLMGYRSTYYLILESLLNQRATIDRIGVQNHIFCGVSGSRDNDLNARLFHLDPDKVLYGLEVLSSFGKPLEITEVTLPTFGESKEAQQLQADLLRVLYTIWFSTPLMDGIVYWNVADQTAISEPGWDENACLGGLFHHDMTPKLSALELKRLFEEEWHTDLELVTDERGRVTFRGFFGEYAASAAGEDFTFGHHRSTPCMTMQHLGAK